MKQNLLHTSIVVSFVTILSRILGFLREVTLAANFGAGVMSDAFVIALTAPSVVLVIFTGAITAVYIPQYTSTDGDRNHFTSNLITMLFIIGFLFAVFFSIFPQTLVYLFAANISPETFSLAIQLLRIMIWSAIPALLLGIFRGFLQIKQMFFVAMTSDAIINVFIIASILSGKVTGNKLLLGFGTVIGNVVSILFLAFISAQNGLSYRPRLELNDPHIKEMLLLMLPLMISSAVLEVNQIVDKNLASSLISGTVSSLNYAAKINNIITALVGTSVGIALFPKMSELAAESDFASLKKYLIENIKTLFPLLLPLTVGMALMAEPATRLLLERGAFNPDDTTRTADCLQMYSLGLLAANLTQLVTRVFYAMRQVKWPAILSAIALLVGIVLSLLLIGPLEHRGLALSASISSTLSVVLLLTLLRKKIGALGLRSHLKEFGKVTLASTVMGVPVWVAMQYCPILTGTYVQCLIWTILIAGGGMLLYGAMLFILRAEIISKIYNLQKKDGTQKNYV